MIVIVGAGLAGLTCAKVLHEAGRDVMVLEASDGVGGRVRTDEHPDGYRLDRGFQVYFTAYPSSQRHLDYDALNLCKFDPGALTFYQGHTYTLTDPVRDILGALPASVSPAATPLDKLRVLLLKYDLGTKSSDELQSEDSRNIVEYLRERRFSERIIELFFRPFFGGILLDRELWHSEAVFRFYFGMLSRGDTVVPARGMGEIPKQLAAHLRPTMVRLHSPVDALEREDGRVVGVRSHGELIKAEAIVLAVDGSAARELADVALPEGQVSCTTLYFGGDEPLYRGRKILLNASPDYFITDCGMISNVAPGYAPPGKHLLSVSVVGFQELPDEDLATRVLEDLGRMVPSQKLRTYEFLGVYRIPYAQFAQPPGFREKLVRELNPAPGLWLAGEYFRSSSINGAMASGEATARALLARG